MEKMTKKDYFNQLITIVEGAYVENEAELVEFLYHQIELLAKKSNVKTAKQKENDEIVEIVFNALASKENAVTASDLMSETGLSNQKISAMLKKLVDAGRVAKTSEKRKSYFSVI